MDEKSEFQIIGNWAFLDETDAYCEAYFSDSKIFIYSENNGKFGPYDYTIIHDSLFYNGNKYAIVLIKCDSLILSSFNEKYVFTKFLSNSTKIDSTSYNPFYLRRCNFLVNNGRISVSEAIIYLNSLDTLEFFDEEIIKTNKR